MDIREGIERAIKLAGSETKLGDATGYTQNAIWQAKTRGTVSPAMALAIHQFTGGEVSAHDLCPVVYPTREIAEMAAAAAPQRQEAGAMTARSN